MMRVAPSSWAVLLALAAAASAAAPGVPEVVASGFTWAENAQPDCSGGGAGAGTLWVTESHHGQLWRVQPAANGTWSQALHVDAGVTKMAGLALAPDGTLYALANTNTSKGCHVLRVNKAVPESTETVAVLPRPCLGDGLAYQPETRSLLVSNEGDFVPGNGAVYRVDLPRNSSAAAAVVHLVSGTFATDGARYDAVAKRLFVSEVVESKCLVIDPATGAVESRTAAPDGVLFLDDFDVVVNATTGAAHVLGASFGNGRVVRFDATNHQGALEVLTTHAVNPTSVRVGCPTLGGANTVFITEGGAIKDSVTDRRVLMLSLP